MSQENQNGNTTPVFKEGELVLFVRLVKATSEFQCIFPDLMTALALHKLAGEYLDSQVRGMFQQPQRIEVPAIPPGMDMGKFLKKH